MNITQLLRKKRDGEEFTKEEISFLVQNLVCGCVSESQIGKKIFSNIYVNYSGPP